MTDPIPSSSRLEYFPISFFAMVMGLSGLTIGWEKAQHVLGWQLGISPWLAGSALLIFALLALLYGTKVLRFRAAVLAELRHPVKLNFFPAISISLLLLSIAFLHLQPELSRWLWYVGTLLHLGLTFYVINVWMHHEHLKIPHMNPAWFIPVVGNVLVPVAGVGFGFVDLSWFFFSFGMLFWILLLANVFNRILFHDPIDERLLPTLFILIAPPAVGFIAYSRLVPEIDTFARMLYFSGLFLTLLLLTQAPRFLRLKFFLSWWAYSFPLAAISIASFVMAERSGTLFYRDLGLGLLVLLTLIVILLLVKTALAVKRGGICVPGH